MSAALPRAPSNFPAVRAHPEASREHTLIQMHSWTAFQAFPPVRILLARPWRTLLPTTFWGAVLDASQGTRHLAGVEWSFLLSGGREVQQYVGTTICHQVSEAPERHPVFLGSSRWLCPPPLQSSLACCVVFWPLSCIPLLIFLKM